MRCCDVRFPQDLRAERLLEEYLLRLVGIEEPRDSFLKAFWHLPLGVVRPVSIFDQSHQRAHQNYHQVLPPDSRQSQSLQDVLELKALLEPLALPRGIEPLFQP
jgi:hypothetical protein